MNLPVTGAGELLKSIGLYIKSRPIEFIFFRRGITTNEFQQNPLLLKHEPCAFFWTVPEGFNFAERGGFHIELERLLYGGLEEFGDGGENLLE
jgi:hypothetical protein